MKNPSTLGLLVPSESSKVFSGTRELGFRASYEASEESPTESLEKEKREPLVGGIPVIILPSKPYNPPSNADKTYFLEFIASDCEIVANDEVSFLSFLQVSFFETKTVFSSFPLLSRALEAYYSCTPLLSSSSRLLVTVYDLQISGHMYENALLLVWNRKRKLNLDSVS